MAANLVTWLKRTLAQPRKPWRSPALEMSVQGNPATMTSGRVVMSRAVTFQSSGNIDTCVGDCALTSPPCSRQGVTFNMHGSTEHWGCLCRVLQKDSLMETSVAHTGKQHSASCRVLFPHTPQSGMGGPRSIRHTQRRGPKIVFWTFQEQRLNNKYWVCVRACMRPCVHASVCLWDVFVCVCVCAHACVYTGVPRVCMLCLSVCCVSHCTLARNNQEQGSNASNN